MKNALGLIETMGLTAAVEAADTAVKSANVRLIGYELARGDGMTTVKIEGDVGAVKAAVQSAKSAAALVGKVVSVNVIPRPAMGLDAMVFSKDTVGYEKEAPKEAEKPETTPPEPVLEEKPENKEPEVKPEDKKAEPEVKAEEIKPEAKKPEVKEAPEKAEKEAEKPEEKPAADKKDGEKPADKKPAPKRTAKPAPKPPTKKEGE